MALGIGGVEAWRTKHQSDWNALKPVWWLKREARGTNAASAAMARGDLWLRNAAGVIIHVRGRREGVVLSLGRDELLVEILP